jgi:hypothetical protein
MKNLTVFLFALCITFNAFAQKSVTGYGAGTADLTTVDGNLALNVGGYGGVFLNHRWLIGGSGNNIFYTQKNDAGKQKMQFTYYGLYNEFYFNPQSKFQVVGSLTTGIGAMNIARNDETKARIDGDWVYVVQPSLGVSFNVFSFMRVNAKAGYRFTGETNGSVYTGKNVNGLNAGISLLFGKF